MSSRWSTPATPPTPADRAARRRAARRRRARRRAGLALAAVMVLAALAGLGTGLARGGQSDSSGRPVTGKPRSGGTLTVTFQSPPASLDPAVAWDAESWSIERLTYQTLVTFADKPGEAGTRLVPGLASTVPSVANGGISDNGLVYTFHIRPGVRFAAPVGTAVTASDVEWSFERMLRQPAAPATSLYVGVAGAEAYRDAGAANVSGVKVVDARTIQFRLVSPDAAFLCKMALPFTSVMSRAWCAKVGTNIDRRPLGTGPYVIKNWTSRQITAVRNLAFAQQGIEGQQYVDQMRFLFSEKPADALHQLEQGQVDVLGDPIPASAYAATKDSGDWGPYVVDAPQLAWYYLFMNINEGYFRNSRVRRAVACAINEQAIAKLVGGQGLPLDQLYPAGLPGHQSSTQSSAYDPAKAKRLLAAAGVAHGFTTTLYIEDAAPQPQLAAAIRADLAAVGIKVEVTALDPAVYETLIAVQRTHVPMGLSNWYQDYPDPSDWIGPLFTDPVDGGNDLSFYDNPQVTKLYEQASREPDAQRRLQLFAQMQQNVLRGAPAVPLFQPVWNGMAGKDVGGFYIHPVWTFDFPSYWKADGR